MGIFDVNVSLLFGEEVKAFQDSRKKFFGAAMTTTF
jgi:hypothetical protein